MNSYKQKKGWEIEFDEKFGEVCYMDEKNGFEVYADSDLKDFIRKIIDETERQAQTEMKQQIRTYIPFLRQWLNEHPSELVTNEKIEEWLFNFTLV